MRFKLLREGVETDSLGNVLSDEQVKYFKNSKIRDRQGRLLVVHHGTFSSFNQFDKGDIGFHFGTEKAAQERQDFTDPDRVIKKEWKIGQYYLNITNFLDMYDIGKALVEILSKDSIVFAGYRSESKGAELKAL